jgi:nicotinate-nucleotide pyrophosphorylase (carboxylating)
MHRSVNWTKIQYLHWRERDTIPIMLDDFGLEDMRRAVASNRAAARPATLEASGGVDLGRIAAIAATGVDCISIGSLTKHVQAIDLSMRLL